MDEKTIDRCINSYECLIMNGTVDSIIHLFKLLSKSKPNPIPFVFKNHNYLGQLSDNHVCICEDKDTTHCFSFGYGNYCDNVDVIKKYIEIYIEVEK